jgi:arylsulfatase A-like enzyme
MADSLWGQLDADKVHYLGSMAPVALAAVVLLWLARRELTASHRLTRRAALLSPFVLLAALLTPCSYRSIQGSTPDVIYLHAMGGLAKQLTGIDEASHVRPRRRTPPILPLLTSRPAARRNILFILTESVRADLACVRRGDDCPAMPFSDAAAPGRLPFAQMRSNSSTTAIELAVLWTGHEPTAGREALHDAPTLFDYAHAANWETAYWTSHHMMFANSRLWVQDLPLRFHCHATTLDPQADVDTGADDRLLTARVKQDFDKLREPFFAMVQYGNTHVPYLVDENASPFQPSRESKAPRDNEAYRNYYKNAVHRQDRTVADLIAHVRKSPVSERTVIVYTSDHAEAFREHGQLGHTSSFFDVEIHVPAWIDAPPQTLSENERASLRSYAGTPTFHTDLPPTLLDLMGLWDASEIAPYRKSMIGGSLLTADRPLGVLSLTNCAGVWGCAFENWGVMHGTRKVHAREWDKEWLCYDVAQDPSERAPLALAACADLVAKADQVFGRMPGR